MYHIHSSNRFSFSFWSGHSVPSTLLGSEWMIMFSSVQLLSCVQFFETPWTTARQASLSITKSWSLPKLTSIESVMPSTHLILCHPLPLLPPIFPSIRVFSNEYSRLISFRINWFDILAVPGTLKSLLQHHSSKAWILQHSAFFPVQLSYLYMPTGKTIALTIWTPYIQHYHPPILSHPALISC